MMLFFLGMSSALAYDWGPNNNGEESYSETYTAFVDLTGGDYLLLQFLFTNAGFGDNKAGCRILIVPKKGESTNSSGNYDKSKWAFKGKTLQVGPCSLEERSGQTYFVAQSDKAYVELSLKAKIQPPRLPDARITSGKGFYEHDLLIPHAQAVVSYSYNGIKKTGKGWAQLDHTRSNLLLPKVAKGWFRFRGFQGEAPVLAQNRTSPKKTSHSWLYDQGSQSSVDVLKVQQNANGATFQLASGSLSITLQEQLYLYEPVKSYGTMGSLAKHFVGNPKTYTYRATATYNGTQIQGIVEKTIVE